MTQKPSDSALSLGRYPKDISNLLEGKKVMDHCIEENGSDRLDSIVKKKKNWKQIDITMTKVHEELPSY